MKCMLVLGLYSAFNAEEKEYEKKKARHAVTFSINSLNKTNNDIMNNKDYCGQ